MMRSRSRVATWIVAVFFFLAGMSYMITFNWTMKITNTEQFCIGCHEMKDSVYPAYTKSIHYSNRSGVRATCSDCHVPHEWTDKIVRKIQASKEVWGKITGIIDTPEKFDQKRLKLAKNVWKAMKTTDSRECRNCHNFNSMNPEDQKKRARKQHIQGMEDGNTCIDCHKGIAHKKVHDQLTDAELTALEQPVPGTNHPIPPQWQALIDGDGKEEKASATVSV